MLMLLGEAYDKANGLARTRPDDVRNLPGFGVLLCRTGASLFELVGGALPGRTRIYQRCVCHLLLALLRSAIGDR